MTESPVGSPTGCMDGWMTGRWTLDVWCTRVGSPVSGCFKSCWPMVRRTHALRCPPHSFTFLAPSSPCGQLPAFFVTCSSGFQSEFLHPCCACLVLCSSCILEKYLSIPGLFGPLIVMMMFIMGQCGRWLCWVMQVMPDLVSKTGSCHSMAICCCLDNSQQRGKLCGWFIDGGILAHLKSGNILLNFKLQLRHCRI